MPVEDTSQLCNRIRVQRVPAYPCAQQAAQANSCIGQQAVKSCMTAEIQRKYSCRSPRWLYSSNCHQLQSAMQPTSRTQSSSAFQVECAAALAVATSSSRPSLCAGVQSEGGCRVAHRVPTSLATYPAFASLPGVPDLSCANRLFQSSGSGTGGCKGLLVWLNRMQGDICMHQNQRVVSRGMIESKNVIMDDQ